MLCKWQETTRVNQVLQEQILTVFDDEYLHILRNMYISYVEVSARDKLSHLYNNHGIINTVGIEDNDTKMRTYYDPTQPIEILFN